MSLKFFFLNVPIQQMRTLADDCLNIDMGCCVRLNTPQDLDVREERVLVLVWSTAVAVLRY